MGYIFSLEKLHEIANRHRGLPHEQMTANIIEDLAEAYPGHIEKRQDWVFSLTAGAVGIMTILHGSLSEYVIIYGSPVGTEGYSGRYHMEVYDFLLTGEMWTYTEERFRERVVTRPGEVAVLGRRQVKGFRISEGSWMLEYGRGLVPLSLPVALADVFFSAVDLRSAGKLLWLYGRQVFKQLLRGKI